MFLMCENNLTHPTLLMSKKECQSPSNSHILQRALSATEGYEVRGGPDGQMVLAVIENKPPN